MKIPFFAFFAILLFACGQTQPEPKTEEMAETGKTEEKSTYFLIRHAEKHRSNPEDEDPKLNEAGMERAQNWAEIFAEIKLDAVYSSDFKRTRQTAKPTAESKGLEIISYDPHGIYETGFIEETKGQNILVVGHSNTIPKLANYLLKQEKYEDIPDSLYGKLFIISGQGENASPMVLNLE